MHTSNWSRHDVVVVGARVAGAATAMLLARLGHDVVSVDQASFPSDTVSTHLISRSGVVQLRRWGLLGPVLASGAPAIRQVTFHAGGESVSRTIKHKAGVDLVMAPRRYVLDTIIAGIANIAAARGVTLTEVSSTVEGDIDLLGILGLSDQVRNGYQQIRVGFTLRGDDPEMLRSVVEQSRRRSAVFDTVTNGVPVSIDVDAG